MSIAQINDTPVNDTPVLLTSREQQVLALRMSLSLAAAACLVVSVGLQFLDPDQHDVAQLVAGLAALLVGVPALRGAWRSLRNPDARGITEQLIALTFIAAWASGDLITATLLPLIMMIGDILEERSLLGSQEAVRVLSRLTEVHARRLRPDGEIETVLSGALRPGDCLELRAGDRVPADGIIETGSSSVDTAPITGESVPVDVEPGDKVFNGAINLDGLLTMRITHVGTETTLGRVIALMQEAENTKPAVARLLERYAPRYLVFVLLLATSIWLLSGNTAAMLAVLVAACPSALVLAAPATSIAAITAASRHGILIKGAAFLEQMAGVDAVVFDKTGTLTVGELRLAGTAPVPGISVAMLYRLAASLGEASSHPVSRALTDEVPEAQRFPLSDVKETRGLGIVGHMDGEVLALGRAQLFDDLGVKTTPPPGHIGPIAGFSKGGVFWGWLLFADEIRPQAQETVEALRALGLERQVMITGDRRPEAERVAHALGIAEVWAEVLPAKKMELVLDEIRQGYRPMVVGDGINDALALKVGAVGVAMGAQGTDVALASADLVLMTNDVRRLATCIRLSRRSRRTILVNVGMAMAWTLVVIGLAAAGSLGSSGALIAALLQNAGILAVLANAGRLLRFHEIDET
jgi:heavy metal translocating P-type ATPase